MNIDGRLSDFIQIEEALPLLSAQINKHVTRSTAASWVKKGYLPGVPLSGGKTVLIPKAAISLFKKPDPGRNVQRINLARGIGIALKCIGEVEVPVAQGIANAKCPRCAGPWVIRGGIPVPGHEGDCCCCSLDCLYIGPDFLLTMTPDARVTRDATALTFRV
jgi:hypothetical protein